jgi:hypothetical protein
VKVAIKEPGQPLKTADVTGDLKGLQSAIGGGYIEMIRVDSTLHGYIDEEGKLKGLPLNFSILDGADIVAGAAVFMRATRDGDEAPLQESDLETLQRITASTEVVRDVW